MKTVLKAIAIIIFSPIILIYYMAKIMLKILKYLVIYLIIDNIFN